MTKQKQMTNEEKLKELTYQHAKMVGEELQRQIQTPLKKDEVDKMDDAVNKGIQLSLEVHELRHLIELIDKNELKELPFVNESPNYKNAYYLNLLAKCTHNPSLIEFSENLKKEVLKNEIKS